MSALFHLPDNFAGISSRAALTIIIILSTMCIGNSELITVGPKDCDYTSIGLGVYYASPGDTVEVESGTYRENIVIKKPIILRGVDTGLGQPIVDADYNESGITIAADGAVVEGFEIANSGGSFFDLWAGVKVEANDSIVANNTLIDNENGILIGGFKNNTLRDNTARDNTYGIKLEVSENNKVLDNNLTGNRYGILLLSSRQNLVASNEAYGNKYGILLNSSENNALKSNHMQGNSYNFGAKGVNDVGTNNLAEGRPIYYLVGLSGGVLNSTSDASTVYCIDCNNMTFIDLLLEKNLYGIFLYNSTYSVLENCSLINNSYGIALEKSSGINARNNRAKNNNIGVALISSNNNAVVNNSATENKMSGIGIFYSEDNIVKDNILSYNYNGYRLIRSNYSEIQGNEMVGNKNSGISLLKCSHNNVTGNSLHDNYQIGISLETSWINEVSNNDILSNDVGLCLTGGIHNNISANNISMNNLGLLYDLSGNNVIGNNTRIGNDKDEDYLPPGSVATLSFNINVIKIKSDLEDAEVWIDGDYFGYAGEDSLIYSGDAGDHEAVLKKKGYPDVPRTFNLPKDKELYLTWKSDPQPKD